MLGPGINGTSVTKNSTATANATVEYTYRIGLQSQVSLFLDG